MPRVPAALAAGAVAPDDHPVPWHVLAPVLAPAVLALVAIFIAEYFVRGGPWRTVLDNAHWTIAYTTAAVLAWLALRHGSPTRALARRWFAAGLTGYAIGQVCWDVQVATGRNPFPAPSDAFYLLLGACMAIGLAHEMRQLADAGRRRMLAIDAAGFAVAALTIVLALYLPMRGTNTALQMAVLIAYPLGMLTAACFAVLLLPALRLRANVGWSLLSGALAFNGWLWLRWNELTLSGQLADGTIYNASFSITALALGVGVARWSPRPANHPALERRYDAFLRQLPLVAVAGAAAALLLVFSYPDVPVVTTTSVAWGAAIVLALAIARQSLLVHERDRMLEMESQFHTLFDSAPEAILLMDAARIIDCNASAERMFGVRAERLVGMIPVELSPELQPDGRASSEAAMERIHAALGGEPQLFRWRHVREGEGPFEAEVALHRVDIPGRTLMQAVVRDVTERLAAEATQAKLEDQLRQASRMEAVGRLAGGVAHDFNNILTVILGTSELSLMKLPASHPLRHELGEIRSSAQRAAALTAQLLAFSRKQVASPVPSDLDDLVRDALGMLERLVGENVALVFEPAGDLGTVLVDRTQFEQVIVNLVVNARDALPRGGRIVIATGNTELDPGQAASRPGAKPGRFSTLSVTDDGDGIPPELVAHVFEPFFTTKELGRGTGLGLSTVYGIVRQGRGFIELDSTPGHGTRFTIHFPVVARQPQAAVPAAAAAAEMPTGRETILLVEDEETVRELARRMLEDLGYRVIEAAHAEEALALARREGVSFDLLLTDVIMPGRSGGELHAALAVDRPGLRTLFVSGYTGNVLDAHGVLERGAWLLQKPFTRAELAAAVRRALDRDAGGAIGEGVAA